MKKLLFTNLILAFSFLVHSQLAGNDATWQNKKTDDFNSSSIDTMYWMRNYWGNTDYWQYPTILTYMDTANAYTVNGYLKLRYEKLNSPYIFIKGLDTINYMHKGGVVISKPYYKYGYYEIKASFPTGIGLYPAFWMFSADSCSFYNEIDVVELLPCITKNADSSTISIHLKTPSATTCTHDFVQTQKFYPFPTLTNYHKHAFLWEKDKITFFVDDIVTYVFHDNAQLMNHSQQLIINNSAGSYQGCAPNSSTPAQSFVSVDWLKIWQLRTDCNSTTSICNYNNNTYDRKVKKSITVGGNTCTSIFNTSDTPSLWATDFILLDEGTTINPDGSGSFLVYTTPCPE